MDVLKLACVINCTFSKGPAIYIYNILLTMAQCSDKSEMRSDALNCCKPWNKRDHDNKKVLTQDLLKKTLCEKPLVCMNTNATQVLVEDEGLQDLGKSIWIHIVQTDPLTEGTTSETYLPKCSTAKLNFYCIRSERPFRLILHSRRSFHCQTCNHLSCHQCLGCVKIMPVICMFRF